MLLYLIYCGQFNLLNMTKAILGRLIPIFLLSPLLGFDLQSQSNEKKWDINNPPLATKSFTLKTDEGTWMNLDVSLDGSKLVFDLLGDIFIMPMTGGRATALRSGLAYEVQPRFSPDGTKILFTSDAGGADNIWVMDVDGSNAEQLTSEKFRLLNNPSWHPNGNYFAARKHFTSTRSLGAGEIWLYHRSGGAGVQLTERKNDQQDVNEPFFSPDGRYIYFSEDMYPGGFFQYNKDPNNQIFIIRRYDTKNSKTENIIGGSGSAFRPTPSNDGKYLAYIRRDRTKTQLVIHQLETGEEYSLYSELSKDQQEAWTIFGIYTGFSWTPDDKDILIWAKGKIRKINVASKIASIVPFDVEVEHKIVHPLQSKQICFEDTVKIHAIRNCITSPDGKIIVFNAAGYLYKMKLPDGQAERLTKGDHFEYEPSFSSDGKELVFVSWDDDEMGRIHKMNLVKGSTTVLSTERGIYRNPSIPLMANGLFIAKNQATNT